MRTYSRKAYPSRGLAKHRSALWDGLNAGNCIICEATLIRKTNPTTGIQEQWKRFLNRKTCGNVYDAKGDSVAGECLQAYRKVSEYNGNWKEIMPKCIECGRRIGYRSPGEPTPQRCAKHYKEFMSDSGAYVELAKKNLGQYAFPKGVSSGVPFKKGQESWSRGKTFEQLHGKRKAHKLKEKLANERREGWISGKYDAVKRESVEWHCKVCDRTLFLKPYYARTRLTCSLSCSGKIGGATKRKIPHKATDL